jgi:putative ABC transport system substrate-binding protein
MERRAFVCTVVGSLFVVPLAALAQPRPRRIARVAILSPGASEARSVFTAFRSGLRELGYQEGRDVLFDFHFANGSERLVAFAQAIAARGGTDLVLADGRVAAQAMLAASRTIPIVAVTGDPVALGLAASLAHPGGNVTGIATLSSELGAKQLELLREILPSARRVGVVNVSMGPAAYRALEDRAASLGVALRRVAFQTQIEAERVLAPAALGDVDGLVVPPSALLAGLSATVVRLVNAAGKPAVYAERDFIAAGGLALYGHDIDDAFRRSASIVDRVLNGANPADTPFEQPTHIAFVINLKTAKALRLTIPQALLLRADEVIQ